MKEIKLTDEILRKYNIPYYFNNFIADELRENKHYEEFVENKDDFTEVKIIYKSKKYKVVVVNIWDNNCTGGSDDRGTWFKDVYFNNERYMSKYLKKFSVVSEVAYTCKQRTNNRKIDTIIKTKGEGKFSTHSGIWGTFVLRYSLVDRIKNILYKIENALMIN